VLASLILLYATLALCGVVLALVVVRYDLYLREPWQLLLIATLLGAAGMHLAGIVQVWMIYFFTERGVLVSDTAFASMAGSTEEIGKILAVFAIWAISRKHFDEPLDGLIFGSFAGLGAALEESVAVLICGPASSLLPPQEPIRLAGHLIMGGIGGFGVGLLATRHKRCYAALIASLLGAIALHTLWDIVAFDASDYYRAYAKLRWWHSSTPVALMIVGMAVYRKMASVGARLTRLHLNACDAFTRQCPPD
jgi:protease PrsW